MRFRELIESKTPSLPGAPSGIKIMSMDEFIKLGGDGEEGGIVPGDMDDEHDEPVKPMRSKRDVDENKNWQDAQSGFYVYSKHLGKTVGGPYYSKRDIPEYFQNDKYKISYTPFSDEKELDEATKLPAQQRDLKGKELADYMDRIRGTTMRDKNGNVKYTKEKVSKKGVVTPPKERYVSGKTKTDKFKLPYMHRSSVISYYNEAGKSYDVDAIKKAMAQRPAKLLKQNEKMKHSNGDFEQFFNIGFAALTGLALDENTNELIVVNTCPGAGSCKVDCFAMKGGKVQFAGPWVSDGRILTYLLNDPEGFAAQLKSEIGKEYAEGQKGSKGFEKGWNITVRWHDAGDFFSPEYMKLAFDIAEAFPGVKFYAYTKMAGAALGDKPENFIVNWSEGANTTQEKQIKAQDSELEKTKNSRIVPEKLFYDLLKKDAKGNLEKTPGGAWQPRDPTALKELKQRLADAYKISAHSILSYDEWYAKRSKLKAEWMAKNQEALRGSSTNEVEWQFTQYMKSYVGMKWNVIVAPGEGDVSANSHDVLSTLLLRH